MQQVVVYLIVACAALVVLRRYAPAALRARLDRFWPGRKVPVKACGGCDGCGDTQSQATISVEALRRTARR